MQHPLLNTGRSILFYILSWIVLVAIQVSIFYYFYGITIINGLVHSLITYAIYAALGLGLWFPVRYIYQLEAGAGTKILNILGLGFGTVLVWYTLANSLSGLIFKNEGLFLQFIRDALPLNLSLGILLYLILILVYFLVMYFTSLEARKVSEAHLQTLVRESELNLLKYKLNPHFLFNSLNSISALTLSEPEKAQEMVLKLSDYLRYSLETERAPTKDLREELEHIQLYLEIEKIRFGDRLIFSTEISDACLKEKVPGMILQPLIENAIKHGVHESADPVTIAVRCIRSSGMMQISVSNEYDASKRQTTGTGTGLSSVQKRLAVIYNRQDLVEIRNKAHIFEVVLSIPVTQPAEH